MPFPAALTWMLMRMMLKIVDVLIDYRKDPLSHKKRNNHKKKKNVMELEWNSLPKLLTIHIFAGCERVMGSLS